MLAKTLLDFSDLVMENTNILHSWVGYYILSGVESDMLAHGTKTASCCLVFSFTSAK